MTFQSLSSSNFLSRLFLFVSVSFLFYLRFYFIFSFFSFLNFLFLFYFKFLTPFFLPLFLLFFFLSFPIFSHENMKDDLGISLGQSVSQPLGRLQIQNAQWSWSQSQSKFIFIFIFNIQIHSDSDKRGEWTNSLDWKEIKWTNEFMPVCNKLKPFSYRTRAEDVPCIHYS